MAVPYGVLLINLGSPEAPTKKALRRYLSEFLRDRRVVDLPRLFWWPILHGIILPFRSGRSAKLYASIWTPEGAPLVAMGRRQCRAMRTLLDGKAHVEIGMRYGSPTIRDALANLCEKGCTRILVFPLYPQYSKTTTASALDAVSAALGELAHKPELRFIRGYHDHPDYIRALAESVQEQWQNGRAERLLMSFHGIPQRYAESGDPYPDECRATAERLARALGLKSDEWMLAFQSRFGREEWLKPYTSEILTEWGKEGIKSVDVICPGFAADCLETLEEIAIQNRDLFLQAGGDRFRYIPALNDRPAHMKALSSIASHSITNWQGLDCVSTSGTPA
jgi:ferrochelatase